MPASQTSPPATRRLASQQHRAAVDFVDAVCRHARAGRMNKQQRDEMWLMADALSAAALEAERFGPGQGE